MTDLNLIVSCVLSLFITISVVPQPVYMNMSDLATMANARAAERQDQVEDGLDLKTPTQEDLDGLPSGSDGSSSGYGSQSTVRVEDQGFADGKLNFSSTFDVLSSLPFICSCLLKEGSF